MSEKPQTDMSVTELTRKIGEMFLEAGKDDMRKRVTMDEAIDTTQELIAQRDRETLIQAAERVRNAYSRQFPHFVGFDGGTCIMSISIDHAIELILATLAEGGKHGG